MHPMQNPTNYLSKDYQGYLSKEIMRFRCSMFKIAISVKIACKSHPNWPVFKEILISNRVDASVFIRDVMSFLVYDNSPELANSMALAFPNKMTKQHFIDFKTILLIAFKTYGISHAMECRIIESLTDLEAIYAQKTEWAFNSRRWWKLLN